MWKETCGPLHPLFYGPQQSVARVAADEVGYHLFKEGYSGRGLLAKAAGICGWISAGLEVGARAS